MEKPIAPREYNRYEPIHWGTKVSISAAEQRVRAEVVDESISGLGLTVKGSVPFQVAQSVVVDNGTFGRSGTIAYVDAIADGVTRVGVHWIPHIEYKPT